MQSRDSQQNIVEHLQDAWTFESRLLELVEAHIGKCKDAQSARMYREHARLTRQQRDRIQGRLEEMGHRYGYSESPGWFTARLNRLAREVEAMDVWRDEATQLLITSYGIKQVECSMYSTLKVKAAASGDHATAALARASLEEEEATARRLLFCIGMATRGKAA